MKNINYKLLFLTCIFSLTACGGGNSEHNSENKQPITANDTQSTDTSKEDIKIYGSVEKGPFVIGSSVTVNVLNEQGEHTDSTIVTNTKDNFGNFNFKVPADSTLQITASGYYRNEITGELSKGIITLRSIYKANDAQEQNANINIITHLTSNRVLELIKNGESDFEKAIEQAEQEFTVNFNKVIANTNNVDFSKLSILNSNDPFSSAYLLTLSSIFYQHAIDVSSDRNTSPDAELTAILNKLEQDFGADGNIDDNETLVSLKESQKQINPTQVQETLLSWIEGNLINSVPDINELLDSDLDGLPNIKDDDDDNDGIVDENDLSPFISDFNLTDKDISLEEDSDINISIETNNPLGTNSPISLSIITQSKFGKVSGEFPNITYSPNAHFFGQDRFTIKLMQGNIISEEIAYNLTIVPVNDAPLIEGTPSNIITANEYYEFKPIASDLDNDTLSFEVKNLPTWLSLDPKNGQLMGQPGNEDAGLYSDIIISVSDGTDTTDLSGFSITVNNSVLDAPSQLDHTLEFTDNTLKPITLNWQAVDFAHSYQVQVSIDERFQSIVVDDVILSESQDYKIEQEPGKYFWRVRTINPQSVTGAWSETKEIEAGIFKRTFGDNNHEIATKTIATSDNGYLILAVKSTENKRWIIKVNQFGEVDWELELKDNYSFSSLRNIYELSDGTFLALGMASDKNNAYILHLDKQGQKVGEFLHDLPKDKQAGWFDSVTETNNGVFAVHFYFSNLTQQTIHKLNFENYSVSDAINLPEIDSNISVIKSRLSTSKSGNLILFGDTMPKEAKSEEYWRYGAFILVLDQNLEALMSYHNTGEGKSASNKYIRELENGNYLLIGEQVPATALTVVNQQGQEVSYQSDYNTFSTDAMTQIIDGHFIVACGQSNGVILKTYNEKLEVISEQPLTDFNEYSNVIGIIKHHDGTYTITVNEKQSGLDTYNIILQKRFD